MYLFIYTKLHYLLAEEFFSLFPVIWSNPLFAKTVQIQNITFYIPNLYQEDVDFVKN